MSSRSRSSFDSFNQDKLSPNTCRGGHILVHSCFEKHQKFIRSEFPCKISPCPHQEDRPVKRTADRCSECMMADQYLAMRNEAEWQSMRSGQSIEMAMMRGFKLLWTTKQDLAVMVLDMNLTKIDNITPIDNPGLEIWDATTRLGENLCDAMDGIAGIYMHFWYSRSKKHAQRPIRGKGGILDQVNKACSQFEEIRRIHDTYKTLWAEDANSKDTPMTSPDFLLDFSTNDKENARIFATPYETPADFWGEDGGLASPIDEDPVLELGSARMPTVCIVGTPTDTPPMSLHSFMGTRDWSALVPIGERGE